MLTIMIPGSEYFDESTQTFVSTGPVKLKLEHSLVSVSKWEANWGKPFLSTKMTPLETMDYIRCMTITQNVDPLVYKSLSNETLETIHKYINAPMTATKITKQRKGGKGRIITAELIYCWMFNLNIPVSFEKWHLNRLLTLIDVCDIENKPGEKMPRDKILEQQRRINAARKAKYHTKG